MNRFGTWLLLAAAVNLACVVSAAEKRPNVLFIMADDLRPELGCYGSPAKTPHIDGLARRGILFQHAYCQQAVCNPSRSSMLTGLRPDTLGLFVNSIHFRELKPDVITLPQWFKQHGYVTRDVGKIFHNWLTKEQGDRRSWSAPEFLHFANHGHDKPMLPGPLPANLATTPRCERRDVADAAYFDGRIADETVRVLAEIKAEPFFLAVGFWKPHAPFNAPQRYWDMYDPARLPPLDPARPKGAPDVAFHDSSELRGRPPNQIDFNPEQASEMRHGYFANTSYMDAQLGKVLAALDKHGLADNTIIVFCGDHGYHLGEEGLWAKTSCFELDARVPLLIVPPGGRKEAAESEAMVELLDLFPTLTELCGLPAPQGLEGVSLAPILSDPTASVKPAAFTQHPRPAYYDRTEKGQPDAMGYSVRKGKFRYTEWRDWESDAVIARELYDHSESLIARVNLADDPQHAEVVSELSGLLKSIRRTRAK